MEAEKQKKLEFITLITGKQNSFPGWAVPQWASQALPFGRSSPVLCGLNSQCLDLRVQVVFHSATNPQVTLSQVATYSQWLTLTMMAILATNRRQTIKPVLILSYYNFRKAKEPDVVKLGSFQSSSSLSNSFLFMYGSNRRLRLLSLQPWTINFCFLLWPATCGSPACRAPETDCSTQRLTIRAQPKTGN
jgi:hypothetical protein